MREGLGSVRTMLCQTSSLAFFFPLSFLLIDLAGNFEFHTSEWWTKQNAKVYCCFLWIVRKQMQEVSLPPCAWPSSFINGWIPRWCLGSWVLSSCHVCFVRELIKNFHCSKKAYIYSSLFVLCFNHLSHSQKSDCLLHISSRCRGVGRVARIHSNKVPLSRLPWRKWTHKSSADLFVQSLKCLTSI